MIILHNSDAKLAKDIAKYLDTDYSYYNDFSCFDVEDDTNLDIIRKKYKTDINNYPEHFDFQNTGLVISDMDSTVIGIECIDEMAKVSGVYEKVAAITESAMLGNLDFTSSLMSRLKAIKNLKVSDLEYIYTDVLIFNKGAKELMFFLRDKNIKTALVSGGFSFFASKVANKLKIDDYLSNKLEIIDDRVTTKILGDIVDGKKKTEFLHKLVNKYDLSTGRCNSYGRWR